jgi:hypothetical protein
MRVSSEGGWGSSPNGSRTADQQNTGHLSLNRKELKEDPFVRDTQRSIAMSLRSWRSLRLNRAFENSIALPSAAGVSRRSTTARTTRMVRSGSVNHVLRSKCRTCPEVLQFFPARRTLIV